MTSTQIIIGIIGLFISISGWVTFFYNHFTYKPKITGQIYQILKGEMNFNGIRFTSYFTYFFLSNKGRNPVYISDVEMRVKIDEEWVKLKRVHGLHVPNLDFKDTYGRKMDVRDIEKQLLYNLETPVKYGEPYTGFVMFAAPKKYDQSRIEFYEANIKDVFGKIHTIKTSPDNFGTVERLKEITKMNF